MHTKLLRDCLLLGYVAALSGTANAQPTFTSHWSIEARIAQADAVVRARIAKITPIEVVPPGGRDEKGILQPDGIYNRQITLTVDEVLKGKVGKTIDDLRVVEAFYFPRVYEEWWKADTSLLWFLSKGPASPDKWAFQVIRLGGKARDHDREEPVLSSNLTRLRDTKAILDRAQTYASISTKKLTTHSFRLPPQAGFGQWSSLIVPVDLALEARARRLIQAPQEFVVNLDAPGRQQLRYAGVTSLAYFKSDANAAVLRNVISEPFEDFMIEFQGPYSIQRKAYEILLAWDMDAPRPKWTADVTSVELGRSPISDSGMKRLATLPNLKSLDLQETQVTANGLRAIAGLKRLDRLALGEGRVDDAVVRVLREIDLLHALSLSYVEKDKRPQLAEDVAGFYLDRMPLTDAGLKEMSGLKNLAWLTLCDTRISGSGFKDLAHLKKLTAISLDRAPVTDAGLKGIAVLENLTSLRLAHTKITDAGLKEIAQLSQLKVLDLEGTAVTANGLRALAGLKNLTVLHLTGRQVNDATLRTLRELGMLRVLSPDTTLRHKHPASDAELTSFALHGTDVTDEGLKELAGLTRLKTLSVDDTNITGAGFKYLAELPSLSEVFARNPGFTEKGLRNIASLGRLRTLHMHGKDVTDPRLRALLQSGMAHALYHASDRTDFPPSTFPPRALTDGTVRSLDLGGWRSTEGTVVTDAILPDIARLKKLAKLDLTHTAVTGTGLKELAKLEHLVDLHLGGFQVTDDCIKDLPSLTKLKALGLHDTKLTSAGMKQVAALPNLRSLKLTGKNVSDAWLTELQKVESLNYLRLYWTTVSAEAVTEFRKVRPNCVIER